MSHSLPQVLTVVVRMKNGGGKATVKCHAYWCTVQIIIIKKTSLDGRTGWGHSLRFMIRHQVLMAPLWILSEVPLSPSYWLYYSDANRVNSELILWYVKKSKHTLHLLGWFFFELPWDGEGEASCISEQMSHSALQCICLLFPPLWCYFLSSWWCHFRVSEASACVE